MPQYADMDQVQQSDIVDAFQDSVGKGTVEQLIEDAKREAGVSGTSYSEPEALELVTTVGELDDASQFVAIAANTIKTRIKGSGL